LAARHGLDAEDPLRGADPLEVQGVVALAGIPDLEAYASPEGCGAAVEGLLGGEPSEVVDRLARSSPVLMLPLGVPQLLVAGSEDTIVPPQLARDYQSAAEERGDVARVVLVEGAGHFELSTPHSVAWPAVRDGVLELAGLIQPD
jgi:pimeloyl-ACP methyl ester carboxylesterase